MKLPKGYDSELGQRGRNVSIGQRQLISFARALVADPQILILDEATANIDSFTELAIQKALKVLFEGRTSLVIAHRLATIRDADRIVVLKQGRIVEQGTHDDLIAAKGLYAHLYSSNYASFDDVSVAGDEAGFEMRT
jgi:ATP-binding cassette subfamily B protein